MFFNQAYASTLPLQGSDIAGRWDNLYDFLVWISIFFFVGLMAAMIHFAIKYRNRPGLKSKYITGNHLLEGLWIVVPTVLLLAIFGWGYSVYHAMTQAPADAYEVRVIGKQWLWQFQYDNGKTTVGELYVPINRPVRLVMTSEDVIHSLFIPNFRIKQDVVPGMYTSVWFEAKVAGKHQIYCTEYCGTSHSGMLAKAIVLDEKQWEDWNRGKKLGEIPDASDEETASVPAGQSENAVADAQVQPVMNSLAVQGKGVFETKGCVSCHSIDGSSKVGPTQKGLWGKKVEMVDGSFVLADENYIRESIENPGVKVVKGFNPMMPTFKGLLSETEMNSVIAYIKSLGDQSAHNQRTSASIGANDARVSKK